MPNMVTFTINISQMLAYMPYMDPMGICLYAVCRFRYAICLLLCPAASTSAPRLFRSSSAVAFGGRLPQSESSGPERLRPGWLGHFGWENHGHGHPEVKTDKHKFHT